jgi:hypothetical protein
LGGDFDFIDLESPTLANYAAARLALSNS